MTLSPIKLPTNFAVQRVSDGNEDHAVFTFPRTGNRSPGRAFLILGDAINVGKVQAVLMSAGMAPPPDMTPRGICSDLVESIPSEVGRLVRCPGWIQSGDASVFVAPEKIYGEPDDFIVYHSPGARTIPLASRGTLEAWQKKIAKPAARSTAVATALLTSLAGPLFRHSTLTESFMINLAGNSSSGKSTANRAAISVWGPPDAMPSWNASARGAAELAYDHNDLVLVFDDIEQGETQQPRRAKKVLELLHQLVSGRGKTYSKTVGGNDHLPDLSYRCIFLSSSPSTLLVEKGTDGDIVRLLEIAVPHGDQEGIWHGREVGSPLTSAELSDAVTKASRENYGVAGDLWLSFLVRNESSLADKIQEHTQAFLGEVGPCGSLESRIAQKVGLLYSASVLAADAEILPWKPERCLTIAKRAYNAIIASAFADKRQEIATLMAFLQLVRDRSAVARVDDAGFANLELKQSGVVGCVCKERLALKLSALEDVVVPGPHAPKMAARNILRALQAENALECGAGQSVTKDVRFADGPLKMVVLRVRELEFFLRVRGVLKSKNTKGLSDQAKKSGSVKKKGRATPSKIGVEQ